MVARASLKHRGSAGGVKLCDEISACTYDIITL